MGQSLVRLGIFALFEMRGQEKHAVGVYSVGGKYGTGRQPIRVH